MTAITAQDSLLTRDYQFVKRQDIWLTRNNAAALSRYLSADIAEAEVNTSLGRGGLVNYNESQKTVRLTAGIESFYRISKRAVVYGRMSYDNLTGRNMAGSAFMQLTNGLSPFPAHYPFDIVEDSLTNTGTKHRDTYQLTGGLGIDVGRGLSLGARADYTAANEAKYKDLRYKNKLMNLQATLGIYYAPPAADWLNLGAYYTYRRATESLRFSTYGRNDRVYKSLISYAAFMGRVEQFGGYGYTDYSREMPLFDEGGSAGIQLEVRLAPGLSFYNEFATGRHSGYYGRQSPYTITYTKHHARTYEYLSHLSLRTSTSRHALSLSLAAERMENGARTYREEQNESGATYYKYYDDVKTANKLWVNTTIGYTADLGICHELPTWTLNAAIALMHRKQTGYQYPYLRRQRLNHTELTVQGTRNLVLRRGVLSVSTGFSYLKGKGEPYEDVAMAAPSDQQDAPPTMEAYLWREYQYLTAPQYSLTANVKYAFLWPGTRIKTFARLSATHRKANQTYEYSEGKDHTEVTFTLGCSF